MDETYYKKLNENQIRRIKQVEELTSVDYGLENEFIPVERYDEALLDLLDLANELQDRLKNLEQDIQDNYKPISEQEQVGWNENW